MICRASSGFGKSASDGEVQDVLRRERVLEVGQRRGEFPPRSRRTLALRHAGVVDLARLAGLGRSPGQHLDAGPDAAAHRMRCAERPSSVGSPPRRPRPGPGHRPARSPCLCHCDHSSPSQVGECGDSWSRRTRLFQVPVRAAAGRVARQRSITTSKSGMPRMRSPPSAWSRSACPGSSRVLGHGSCEAAAPGPASAARPPAP